MEDSAVVPGAGRLAVTTDSFVVEPAVFSRGRYWQTEYLRDRQ